MKIRNAKIKDAIAIDRLHKNAVSKICSKFYTNEQIKAWLKGRSPEGYYANINKGEIFVAEQNNIVIGFGHSVPGEIHAIYVDPDFHNTGAGKSLLKHAIKIALNNCNKVKVDSTLNAESFYQSQGFVKVKNDFTQRNNVNLSIVVMELNPHK